MMSQQLPDPTILGGLDPAQLGAKVSKLATTADGGAANLAAAGPWAATAALTAPPLGTTTEAAASRGAGA